MREAKVQIIVNHDEKNLQDAIDAAQAKGWELDQLEAAPTSILLLFKRDKPTPTVQPVAPLSSAQQPAPGSITTSDEPSTPSAA